MRHRRHPQHRQNPRLRQKIQTHLQSPTINHRITKRRMGKFLNLPEEAHRQTGQPFQPVRPQSHVQPGRLREKVNPELLGPEKDLINDEIQPQRRRHPISSKQRSWFWQGRNHLVTVRQVHPQKGLKEKLHALTQKFTSNPDLS